MKDFRDKVAVITGAASGIGRALAECSVAEGMKVVLADVEEDPLKETEKLLKAKGAKVIAVKTDVSKYEDLENLAHKTLHKFGAVHLLFNNAGVSAGGLIWESTLNDWDWAIGVNLWGVIHGIKVFVPIMLKQQTECHIVNTSSISGLIAGPLEGVYKVTKHGVTSLSETLYTELKIIGSKIGVSVLCPAYVRTNILKIERNRPSKLKNEPDQRELTPKEQELNKAIQEHYEKAIENGMAPEECAEMAFEAIRQDKLYVLTHPDFNANIKQRVDNILHGINPTVPGL